MNAVQEIKQSAPALLAREEAAPTLSTARAAVRLPIRILAAVPIATLVALAVHGWGSKQQPAAETRSYFAFLGGVLGLSIAAVIVQPFWQGLRQWMARMC